MKYFDKKIDKRGVCYLTLTRPEVRNAFDDEMIRALTSEFDSLATDESVRLVVFQGEGKSFCAGADINWMKRMKNYTQEENYLDSRALSGLFETIDLIPKPVIARVQGAALGGGTGLVSVCDYVIASEETKFGLTEVQLGLVPAVISPFVMAKIGVSNARAYFLSGEIFSATKAYELGLVHKVVPAGHLNDELEETVSSFLSAAPQAQRTAKRLIRGVRELALEGEDKVIDFTCKTIASLRVTQEAQEGMASLLEKRTPAWREKES